MLLPALSKAKEQARRTACINNEKQLNGAVILGTSARDPFDFERGAQGYTYKASAFEATDMLFWEADETDAENFNDGSSTLGEGWTRRHSGGAVISLMDGHVDYIKAAQYARLVNDPNRNSLWCYPDSPTGR